MKRNHFRIAAGAVALGAGVAATMAVRGFFDRPGESAMRLMSADADGVIIEDLVPAPNQVMAFRHIRGMLASSWKQNGNLNAIDAELDEWQLTKSIGKYFGNSLAIELKGKSQNPSFTNILSNLEGVAFVSLTDVAAAKAGLQNNLKATPEGFYKLDSGRIARIADGYLQIATSPKWFAKVDKVASGQAKSIATVGSFRAAHGLVNSEANLKCFFRDTDNGKWGVLSGTVDDAGIRVDLHGPSDWMHTLARSKVHTVSEQTLRTLPSGPYLLCAMTQLDSIAKPFTGSLGKRKKTVESSIRGDLVLGIYPSQKPWAGADLLLVLGSNNGATPRDGLRKLLAEVEKSGMSGKHVFGAPTQFGEARLYQPSADTQKMLTQMFQGAPQGVKADVLFKHKTLAYATQGQRVYVATSLDLLKRAIRAGEGKGVSVRADAEFAPFAKAVEEGGQFMLAIDPSRIVAGIMNTATKGNKDAAVAADAIRVAVNGSHIVNINGGEDHSGRTHGHLFIPIDYGRLAMLIKTRMSTN